jgi:uridylate kinase
MSLKKTILLKLTGELIPHTSLGLNADLIRSIGHQIKELLCDYNFAVVIGGGNFFRGAQQGPEVAITSQASHYVGMLATMMNGLIIKDIFEQLAINTTLFCGIDCPTVGLPISAQALQRAQKENSCILFAGGTGNPYFTTDTNAVLRALQLNAISLWKGTKVDGIYTADPRVDPCARFVPRLSYDKAISSKVGVMDLVAFALAQQHGLTIRIFNIFIENALLKAAADDRFGSTVQ